MPSNSSANASLFRRQLLRAHRGGRPRNQLVDVLHLPENLHLAPDLVQEIRYLGGQLALYFVSFRLHYLQGLVGVVHREAVLQVVGDLAQGRGNAQGRGVLVQEGALAELEDGENSVTDEHYRGRSPESRNTFGDFIG